MPDFSEYLGGPDLDAFMAGVQLGIAVAFIVLAALGGVAMVRRIMGV